MRERSLLLIGTRIFVDFNLDLLFRNPSQHCSYWSFFQTVLVISVCSHRNNSKMSATSDMAPIFLGRSEVLKCLENQWKSLIEVVEKALGSYSAGAVVQPVRLCVPVEAHDGILLTMPAYSTEDDALATKLVTVFPQNATKGLPSIHATVLLYDSCIGNLQAIMDGRDITAMRTAAASAVATKYLAKKDSRILAILGAGEQARSHYQALSYLYKFHNVRIWNVNKESAEKLVCEVKASGLNAVRCDSVEETVKDADIIVTATMATEPILYKQWVKHGAHINAVGAPVPTWQELSEDLMQAATVYVDSREGALKESGDIIKSKAEIYAEIGEVVNGTKEALPEETTVFKSLGMAVEDVVTAKLVFETYMKNAGKK